MADDDVKVPKGAHFFEEAHMAGVKPIVTACDNHFFSS